MYEYLQVKLSLLNGLLNKVTAVAKVLKGVFLFLLLLSFQNTYSQSYPITASLQIIPPYSVYLPDYCLPGSDKIRVILLQNDLTVPVYDVRLQMTIEWNGSVIMRTSPNFQPRPITLNAGVPNLISGDDLCIYLHTDAIDFSGYSRENYERTKALPEGAYKISFTAYDYHRQNVQVSNIGSNIFFLQKNNPPLLNSPVCNSRVQKTEPQFIVFNWSNVNTPSLPGNETEYTFSLYEIKPKNSNPNYIVKSSRPVFTTVTESNTFQYTPGEPALLDSMEYVWMVQARSKDGRDLYANQGYSIPCKFTYGGVDPFAVKYIGKPKVFAEPIHEKAAKVWWAPARETEKVELYRIEYRGTTNSIGEFPWHTEERKTDTTLTVYPLEPDREYDVRMRYKVSGVYGPYSEIIKFKTPPHKVVECGQPPNPLPLSTNTTPLPSASVGTIVRIGLFDVILTQVSGENGTFSGKGKIVTLGFGFGMALQFKDLFINSDKVVTRGEMYSEGDSMDTFIQKKLDKQHGGGDTGKPKTGDVIPDITTTLSILSIDDVAVDQEKGTITIKDQQTGKEEVINYKEKNHKLPLTIEDKNGNLYNVDKNGKVSPAGKRGSAGSIPPLATLNTLNPELGKIIFGPGNNNKYAFDTWKDSYTNAKELLTSRYENLNGYRVSAKAIAPGEQEVITARLEKPANSNIDPTKIKFVSGKGITYPSTNQGNNFTITITGGPADDAQEVFAIVNNNGKDISIGKLLVASYAIAEKKLVLVPIGNLKSGLQEAITQGMKKAYAPITVNYTVEVDNSFANNKEWDKNNDTKLQDSKSPFLSNDFTGEEKSLVKTYKRTHTIDKDAVYLFVVNEAALRDGDLLGKMPRQSQFGFLFVQDAGEENIARTAAHEIGHGAYTLSHTFSPEVGLPQGSTNTLMDYSTGYDLLKFQWDVVHQPGNVWGVFEDDKEGLSLSDAGITADEQTGSQYNLSPNPTCSNFLTKAGYIVSLNSTAYNKVEIKDGFLIAIIDKQGNRFGYSQTWKQKEITAEIINDKRITKEKGPLLSITFVNWIKVQEEENKPNSTIKSEYVKDGAQHASKIYHGLEAYSIKPEQIQSCSSALQIVERYDAQGPVCRNLTEEECKNFRQTKSIFGSSAAEIVKACDENAYYQPHNLIVEAADGTTTWGEKLVNQLNYRIVQNSKNKVGDDVLTAKLDGVKYIESANTKYSSPELNSKMAYLEISTGYQFYIKFIESSCSFVQAHADTFASDVLSNSNLSKEKGIYCLVIHNTRVSGSNSSAAYSLATAFGSQVPADVAAAIKNTLAVSLQTPPTFSQALIQVYKLIPKQKTTYYYYIKAVSQARVEAWPGKNNSHSPISPSYGPLTGDIRHEIKKETNTTGNAIDAHYFIVDASGDNMQYIQNIEYELKEEYVAFSSQKVAMLYGEKFGHWMLVGWNYSNNQGANSPVDINYRPNVSSCHFTLSKPCSEVLIGNIILVADLVAIPFGLPAIVPVVTAAIIYYASTGQWDQAGIYLGAYLLPPAVSKAVKGIGQATRTFIRFSTKSVVSVLSKDLRIAWEIRGMVSRGLSEQGMQTLLAKQLNPTTCVEYIIPHETYKNLWVKVSQQEAMTGSFELVDGEMKLVVRGYSSGKNYTVSSLKESSTRNAGEVAEEVRKIAEEALAVGRGGGKFIAKSGVELKTFLNSIVNKPLGKTYNGKMYRYIPDQYSDPKLIVQTPTSDATNRFRTGLYLSETKAGNLIEAGSYGGTANKQLYEFTNVQVNSLLDLTDANTIETLGTTFEQMKLIGVSSPYEFTQEVAIWAKNNGYSGVKFFGSQGGSTIYTNFVIFEQSTVNSAVNGYVNAISW